MSDKKSFCDSSCPYLIKAVNCCLHPKFEGKSEKLKRVMLFKYEKICDKPLQRDRELRKRKLEKLVKKH